MREKVEIYPYDKRIKRLLVRIKNSPIDPTTKKSILEFYYDSLARGLTKARLVKYLYILFRIATLLKKPVAKTTKNEISNFVQKLEGKKYSEWTKHDYKVILKIFYRWLRKTEEYPEEVKWIKTNVRNNHLLPDEILTETEIKTMTQCAINLRNKAFILVLYESGCRIGEILTLRIKNVHFDSYGAVLLVTGKTGDRRVRIIAATPKLSSWIENHPRKDDPDAPLWVSLSTNNLYGFFSYPAAKKMLKETAKKAGIKKRIYPHLFRHSRATFLANFLTESQLKQHFGWVQSSGMASVYVHLSGRDVDNALLKLQGIKIDKEKREPVLEIVLCQRCSEKNSPTSKFCMRCGSPLDLKGVFKVDELRTKADKLMSALIKDPDILEKLLNKLENIQS